MNEDEIEGSEERVNPNVLMATLLDEANSQLGEIHKILSHMKLLQDNQVKKIVPKEELTRFNTGLQTITNAVTTIPDILNTNPVTGYTLVPVWQTLIPNRIVEILYFLNLGPGTIFVRVAHSTLQFEEQEISVFAGNVVRLENVFNLLIRATTANTRYLATEYDIGSWTLLRDFADRTPLPVHINVPFTTFGIHGQTIRATYTVPTNKQAKITGVYAFIENAIPAQLPGRRNITVGFNSPSLGISGSLVSSSLEPGRNGAGDLKEEFIGLAYTLLEGESINISTGNSNSAGGSPDGDISVFASCLITEYFPIPVGI